MFDLEAWTDRVDQVMVKVGDWRYPLEQSCPDGNYKGLVIQPWFVVIGPKRAYQYGVDGLVRFGIRGIFYQMINCVERHRSMRGREDGWSKMGDNVKDAFGYSVLMAVIAGISPRSFNVLGIFPPKGEVNEVDAWYESLIEEILKHPEGHADPYNVVTGCFQIAYGMYQEVNGA